MLMRFLCVATLRTALQVSFPLLLHFIVTHTHGDWLDNRVL